MSEAKVFHSNALLSEGNSHWFDGNPKKAMECYEKAVSVLSTNAPAVHRVDVMSAYALCLCETGDFATALAIYPELFELCEDNGLNPIVVLRQWGKALEQIGDFVVAREAYERVLPDQTSAPLDQLKWNHAMGLLNWRDGRLSEARNNLAKATDLIPKEPTEAGTVLAVLGNDALLSLELGDIARAMRLANQMMDIHNASPDIPLSSELNLVRVRATLEFKRQDWSAGIAILQHGISMLENRVPDDWMRRLDLVNEYVAAVLEYTPDDLPINYIASLCAEAPDSYAWIGRLMLARLEVENGALESAKVNISRVLAASVCSGRPESEMKVITEMARLCEASGNKIASIFLGKLTLKYLANTAYDFEGEMLQKIVGDGYKIVAQTCKNLRALGRFEEILALETIVERIQRYVLVLQRDSFLPGMDQPVPFTIAERRAEAAWLRNRTDVKALRDAGDIEGAEREAFRVLEELLGMQSAGGLAISCHIIAPPPEGCVRLSFVPKGDVCNVHYRGTAWSKSVEISESEEAFFALVSEIRNAVSDDTAWRLPAEVLYDHLIAPIEKELQQIQFIEIDARGLLGRIPFALLSDGNICLVQRVSLRYVLDVVRPETHQDTRRGLLHCSAFETGPLAMRLDIDEHARKNLDPIAFIDANSFTRGEFIEGLGASPAYLSIATHLDNEPTRPEHWSLSLGNGAPLYLTDLGGKNFDFNGLRVAFLATCSSGLHDATDAGLQSLASITLEKGVTSFVGTLWEISETAAAQFADVFWAALNQDQDNDPASILAALQSKYAKDAFGAKHQTPSAGGIGARVHAYAAADWAAFAVFETATPRNPDTKQQQISC